MKTWRLLAALVLSGLAVIYVGVGAAEKRSEPGAADTATNDRLAAARGQKLYEVYCASCHGEQGLGDGPLAQSVMPAAPDLTRLSKNNKGDFPLAQVKKSIDGRRLIPGHKKGDMPIWGLALQETDSDYYQEDAVTKKIHDLAIFVKTLQEH